MREIKFRAWDKKGQIGMIDNPKLDVVLENKRYVVIQFTGLKDKNGKEIYEGDVLRFLFTDLEVDKIDENYIKARVVFEEGRFFMKDNCDSKYYFDEENCEVIGNIYKNPELLEEKK